MAQRIEFPAPHEAALVEHELEAVTGDKVRIRAAYSLISAGTEGLQFRRSFSEDSHWAGFVTYPYVPGYATAGIVEEIGPDVTDVAVGDRVAGRTRHASESVLEQHYLTRVPDEVGLADACWFALAKIALMGAYAAEYRLGDTVAVVGAGPIGQMTARWAVAAGAYRVWAVDPVASRLDAVERGGATGSVAGTLDDVGDDEIERCGGRPRVVVDTTGNAAAYAGSLRLAADCGRVVLLGDTGYPHEQRLTPDLLNRGLTVVGAHDRHSGGWEHDRPLHELFFELVRRGRFPLDGLITHVLAPAQCQTAYELAGSGREDVLGVAFEWPVNGSTMVTSWQ